MKRALRIWIGIVLAFIAIGAIVGAIMPGGIGGRIGSGVIGAVCAFFALRLWARTPDARSPRP